MIWMIWFPEIPQKAAKNVAPHEKLPQEAKNRATTDPLPFHAACFKTTNCTSSPPPPPPIVISHHKARWWNNNILVKHIWKWKSEETRWRRTENIMENLFVFLLHYERGRLLATRWKRCLVTLLSWFFGDKERTLPGRNAPKMERSMFSTFAWKRIKCVPSLVIRSMFYYLFPFKCYLDGVGAVIPVLPRLSPLRWLRLEGCQLLGWILEFRTCSSTSRAKKNWKNPKNDQVQKLYLAL